MIASQVKFTRKDSLLDLRRRWKMSIYIVRNELNEEVSAYTDPQRAKDNAEQFQYIFDQHFSVEELIVDSSPSNVSWTWPI